MDPKLSTSGAIVPQAFINWDDLTLVANRIFTAFHSLNAEVISKGLVLFDKEKFLFERRCTWTDSHIIGSIATRGDKRATFESCHAGFYEINNLAVIVFQTVSKYIPQPDSLEKAKEFLILLTKIQTTIDSITKPGIAQLFLNYTSVYKHKQAASIQALGADSMLQISKSWKKLESCLNPHIPNLQIDLALKRFMLQADPLLSDREIKVVHLRKVEWNSKHGVVIPRELILDCLKERLFAPECTKAILRNAVCLLRLPTFASEIPTLGGKAAWKPIRLSNTSEFCVVKDEGVTGTCERNNLPSDNLCNFYYRNEPTLVMSCGANKTNRQTQQLASAMKSIFEKYPQKSKRAVALQLNSFFKEEDLINGVHANIALNEEYFQDELNIPDLSFLHVNVCFNAATVVKNEDPQSLKGINIDGLARISGFVFNDVKQLLKENPTLLALLSNIQSEIHEAEFISTEIISLKKTIQSLDGNVHHQDKMTLSAHMAKERKSPEVEVKPGVGSINDDPYAKIEFSMSESPKNSPSAKKKDLQAYKTSLAKKQDELIAQLKSLPPLLKNIHAQIEVLKTQEANSTYIEKSLQVLKALEQLLALQLKDRDYPTLSRSTEIELLFYLFDGLNMIPLIMCYSGLDRSGQARAIYESLLQMEENIYQKLLSQKGEINGEEETACRLEARKKILHLILNADRYRKELSTLLNSLPNPTYVDDLATWEKGEKGTDIRERLIQAIYQKYPATAEGKFLNYMLEYTELIFRQLFIEMEKTKNSSGAYGLKYGLDGQGLKSYFANFHVLDRWPPFIFVGEGAERRAIKIIEYYEGWWSITNRTTSAANSLILRLSNLRGN